MPVGGVAEWSNAPVLKTDVRESVPRVRIPVPPPLKCFKLLFLLFYFLFMRSSSPNNSPIKW